MRDYVIQEQWENQVKIFLHLFVVPKLFMNDSK